MMNINAEPGELMMKAGAASSHDEANVSMEPALAGAGSVQRRVRYADAGLATHTKLAIVSALSLSK